MTKYSITIETPTSFLPIAIFDEKATMDAMIAFAETQFENGNSLTTPGENIRIVDMTTGEVVWEWLVDAFDWGPDGDDYPDDVDESAYDPYMGCDFYESCDIGGDW